MPDWEYRKFFKFMGGTPGKGTGSLWRGMKKKKHIPKCKLCGSTLVWPGKKVCEKCKLSGRRY